MLQAKNIADNRIYAGLHYRFDGDAGLELGRNAARIGFDQNAGRFNVLDIKGVTVVCDYGHNVDALRALLDLAPATAWLRTPPVFVAAIFVSTVGADKIDAGAGNDRVVGGSEIGRAHV